MTKSNKLARLELTIIYGKICMLGEPVTTKNYLTYHHIVKKQHGGSATIKNGALLSKYMHEVLHQIELYYYQEYNIINQYFHYYKETRDDVERMKMNQHVKVLEKSFERRC